MERIVDFSPLLNDALEVVALVAVPVAGLLVHAAIGVANKRLHLDISAADEASIGTAVQAGAGLLRAKLVSGEMTLPQVTLGSPHVDQAAILAINLAQSAFSASGLTKEGIAARIVAATGHALGEDPQVPSVASPAGALAKVAAIVALLLGAGGMLAACTPAQVQSSCAADALAAPIGDAALGLAGGSAAAAGALDAAVVHPLVVQGCTAAEQAQQAPAAAKP